MDWNVITDEELVTFYANLSESEIITDLSNVCADAVTTVEVNIDPDADLSYCYFTYQYLNSAGLFTRNKQITRHGRNVFEIDWDEPGSSWDDNYSGSIRIELKCMSSLCGLITNEVDIITCTGVLSAPPVPMGSSSVCQDASVTYNINPISGATQYDWELSPTTAGTLSESGTNATVNFSPTFYGSAQVRVRARNCGWSNFSSWKNITVTQLPAQATTPSGQTVVCQGSQNVAYTTSATRASSYTFSISPSTAASITVSGSTAYLDFSSSFTGNATLYATGVNCGSGPVSSGRTITVNPLPGTAGTPTGNNSVCKGAAGVSYSTTGASNASSYTWQLSPSTAGTVSGTGTTGTVTFASSFSGAATLRVRGESCGSGNWSSPLTINVANDLGTPVTPSGTVELCQNPANTTYTISSLPNASSYVWELSPTDAGLISGTSTSGTVDWSSSYNGTATVRVRGVNGCGSSAWSNNLSINIAPLPGTCAQPTGTSSRCQGSGTSNYTVGSADNATSYQWELSPAGAGSVAGSTTTGTVTWNASYTGTATVRVRGVNDCGNGAWSSTHQITVNPLPGKAATPIGTNFTCQGSIGLSYSTAGADFATGFAWEISPVTAGMLIQNGTLATLNLDEDFTGTVSIRVRGVSCGAGAWSDNLSLTVASSIDSASTPTGEVELCQDAANTTYTVSAIANAQTYEWNLSPSSAGLISGTSTTATVNWSSTFNGNASISVRGRNTCGTSNWSVPLVVTLDPLPGACPVPTGSTSICQGTTSVSYSHTGSLNSDSYIWELSPSNAGTISGSGTTATANFNSSFTGTATIRVRGVNGCGNGAWSDNLQVLINPLPGKASVPIGTSSLCQGTTGVAYNTLGATFASSYDWDISPSTAGTLVENGTSVTVNFAENFTGQAILKVRGLSCGAGPWSDNFTINVIPSLDQPSLPIGDVEICQNAPNTTYTTLKVNAATSYDWSILPVSAGIIINYGDSCAVNWSSSFTGDLTLNVRAYNTCGYSEWSDELNINVSPLPGKSSMPTGPSYLCQGGEVQLHVDSIQNATRYKWDILPLNAFNFASDSTQNNVSISISDSYSGRIYYKVYGENLCGLGEVSQNIFLDVLESPDVPQLTVDSVNCYGEDVSLFVTNNFGNFTTKWYDSQEKLLGSGDNINFSIDDNTGFVYVQYNSTNGCSSPLTKVSMNVPPKVIANFSAPITSIKNGEAITFVNESSSNASTYSWDFGDGLTSKLKSPVHSYFNNGKYDVRLTAYDKYNCFSSMLKEDLISVSETGVLSVSNIKILGIDIYPNPSDGLININTEKYDLDNEIDIKIYNSLGQFVLQQTLNTGSVQSIDLSDSKPGLYILQITVNDFTNSKKIIIE
ncbi:MAG: T9SS type A sorting domain-containing protein [Ignavibacteria bacterium]|nr:T9SS type A sorting domain-containing protein [Ignavibacteria bacterium]